jgi:hypothetical protein
VPCFTCQKDTRSTKSCNSGAQNVFKVSAGSYRNSAQYRPHNFAFHSIRLSFRRYKVSIITGKYEKDVVYYSE